MTTFTPPLAFTKEDDFCAAFPWARKYQKANDPRFPTFLVEVNKPIAVKKPWGAGGTVLDVECDPETHVLLVNTAAGECYPCKAGRGEDDLFVPAGYIIDWGQADTSDGALVVVSEPILAVQTPGPVQIQTFEGVHEAPAGAWLCYSASKGLYHVRPEKWEQMGYAPVDP